MIIKKWRAADIEDLTVAVKRKKAKQVDSNISPTQIVSPIKTKPKTSGKLTLENFFKWTREKTDFEKEHEEEISYVFGIIDKVVSGAKEYGHFSREKTEKLK